MATLNARRMSPKIFPPEKAVLQLFKYVRDSIRYDNDEFSLQTAVPDSAPDGFEPAQRRTAKGHASSYDANAARKSGVAAQSGARQPRTSLAKRGQPHVNQFDHMIVEIPPSGNRGAYFLDPTEKFSAFRPFPLDLEGKNALVLDAENPELVSIPKRTAPEKIPRRSFTTSKSI